MTSSRPLIPPSSRKSSFSRLTRSMSSVVLSVHLYTYTVCMLKALAARRSYAWAATTNLFRPHPNQRKRLLVGLRPNKWRVGDCRRHGYIQYTICRHVVRDCRDSVGNRYDLLVGVCLWLLGGTESFDALWGGHFSKKKTRREHPTSNGHDENDSAASIVHGIKVRLVLS
ncbi:hypothetical protein EV127DRAFT_424599 [Xylaria flabelliformis]|nr:hypothetical protein EV127DRAFT_424599 [Xylaria flabelliformis]